LEKASNNSGKDAKGVMKKKIISSLPTLPYLLYVTRNRNIFMTGLNSAIALFREKENLHSQF